MGLRMGASGFGRCEINWLVALIGMVGGIAGLVVRLGLNCSPMQPCQARNDVFETLNNLWNFIRLTFFNR